MADEAGRSSPLFFGTMNMEGVLVCISFGEPVNDSKQFYAQSFALYAMAEYARIFKFKES